MRVHRGLVLVALIGSASSTGAAPVTFEFQGVVTQVVEPYQLDGSVSVGTPFTGSYTYDPLAPNTSPDPQIAHYVASAFQVAVGNYEFRSVASNPDVLIFIRNDPDRFGINSRENEAIGAFPLATVALVNQLLLMQWLLTGGDALSSLALPGTPPDLDQWLGSRLTIAADKNLLGDGLFYIYGDVTTVVPEPATAWLLFGVLPPMLVVSAVVRKRARRKGVALVVWLMAACGAISALPKVAGAQAGGGGLDVLVNDPSTDALGVGVTQQETTIAVRQVGASATICVGFRDYGNHSRVNGFASSGNGGASFVDGGVLPAEPGQLGPFADPTVVVGSSGEFLYGSLRGGLQVLDLHASANCDGFPFAERIVYAPPPPPYPENIFTVDKPVLAHDSYPSSPNFGTTWAAYWRSIGTEVWVSSSTDAGSDGPEWSAHEKVSGVGSPMIPAGYYPWPAVAPTGELYVAFMGGPSISMARRSAQGGWTKMTPVTLSGAAFSGDAFASDDCNKFALKGWMRSTPFPQLAIHSDPNAPAGYVIHAVWHADPDGAGPGTDIADVFHSRSTDGAVSWSPPMRVNDDAVGPRDQWNPALAVAPSGIVAISWYDRRLDPNNWWFDRYLRVSDDGGLRWSKNIRISDVSSPVARMIGHIDGASSGAPNCDGGDYDQVAISGDTIHLAWSDARDVSTLPPCDDPNNPDPFYAQYCPNPNVYYDRVVVEDFDGDGVADLTDRCPTIEDPDQADDDGDGVGNVCDTCLLTPNPPFTGTLTNRTLVSGQLDDDADGRGNECDFDYNNAGLTVTVSDFNDGVASEGKSLALTNCGATVANGGSGADKRCYLFDHVPGGLTMTVDDFNALKANQGKSMTLFPKCATCAPPFSRPIGSGGGSPLEGRPVCEAYGTGSCSY